jgi:hypothetical protein
MGVSAWETGWRIWQRHHYQLQSDESATLLGWMKRCSICEIVLANHLALIKNRILQPHAERCFETGLDRNPKSIVKSRSAVCHNLFYHLTSRIVSVGLVDSV